ncbi:MAG: tyrosine-type recombinase/integrase [Sphingomonadaceae bacterium]
MSEMLSVIPTDALGQPVDESELMRLRGGERVEWDPRMPGFGLRHRSIGGRSWILLTRVKGKLTKVTLGKADTVTRMRAKQVAEMKLLKAKSGEDPQAAVKEARESPTFRAFTAIYLEKWASNWKPATEKTNRGYIQRALMPAFGRLHLDQITRALAYEHYVAWSETSPGAAERARQILSHMFVKASEWGYALPFGNPCVGFPRNGGRNVGRYLTNEELMRFGGALDALEPRYPVEVGAVRLMLFSGCRIGEILGLRWDNLMGASMYIRDSKTGPRQVLLNEVAMAVLDRIPRSAHSPWLFPKRGRAPGHRNSINHFWNVHLLPLAGLDRLRRHDLRHTFASHAALAQENTATIAALLGHRATRNTHRYMHLADQSAIDAAEKIGALLCGLLERGEGEMTSKD